MLRFLKISPECVCESWNTRLKFTVKLIYCSYEALTTHSIIIAKFQHFFLLLFVAPFTLPSHRSFFHSFPRSCCFCYWFDNNIISYFYMWREQLSLSYCRISLMSYVCEWRDVSMTRYSMELKNWIYSLKCTWHAGFFYVKSWRWYLGNWVFTEYGEWNSITAPLFMARFTILWNLQMMLMHTKLNLFS